jgi:hypothetical protein
MPFAEVKPIYARKMNIRAYEREILNALKEEGQDDQALFNKVTATWQGDKPTFGSKIGYRGTDAYVRTEPGGSRMGVKKITWLDKGTSTRWAVMGGGWKSKTRPGVLTSYRGRGKPIIIGRRAMQRRKIRPRPGIKARGYSETIQKRRAPKFRTRMKQASKRAAGLLYG